MIFSLNQNNLPVARDQLFMKRIKRVSYTVISW